MFGSRRRLDTGHAKGMSQSAVGVSEGRVQEGGPEKFWNSRWQEMQSGHIFEENEAFNWSQKCMFFRVNFCSSQREIEEIQATVKMPQN